MLRRARIGLTENRSVNRFVYAMAGYTKLFSSIVTSTIWREGKDTKIMWVTMLALADKDGIVEGSVPGLADMARLTVEEARTAIEILSAPDPDSRSKVEDGRRIIPIDGGWMLVNHAKYRDLMSVEERREYLRIKQAEFREKRKQMSTPVNKRNGASAESTHTSPEAYPNKPLRPAPAARPRDLIFEALCKVNGSGDWEHLTASERGRINKAAKELRSVDAGVTEEEIALRAARYRRKWPTSLTAMALVAHWSEFGNGAEMPSEIERKRNLEAQRARLEQERRGIAELPACDDMETMADRSQRLTELDRKIAAIPA